MARWKLSVRDNLGHAIITLHDMKKPLGMATMPWYDYSRMWKEITALAYLSCVTTIESTFGDLLWQDTVSRCNSDSELAKSKLLEFGWNSEKIKAYAEALGRAIVQKLVEHLPEHEG
jgi:hypothetical protein